jgi:5-methylthioadenosine/S-adenosylhomocysteine deaminase
MTRDHLDDARSGEMSRRDVFRAAAVVAAAPLLQSAANAQQKTPVPEDAGTLESSWRQPPTNRQPIVLRGGTIVSMDPKVGDFATGDVLIDGKKIVSVGPSDTAKAPVQAQVIDATNTIIIPGFVDAHRHSWEGQLRRIIPDGAIAEYMATTHNGFARY